MCLVVISRYSAQISKMLKYAEINIVNITVKHTDITIENIRWLVKLCSFSFANGKGINL